MKIDRMDAQIVPINNDININEKNSEVSENVKIDKPVNEDLKYTKNGEEKKNSNNMKDEKKIIEAIEKANKSILGASTKFEFSIHEKTKAIMVKVLDKETNEILHELPPEKILDMVAKMWEVAGIMIDKKG